MTKVEAVVIRERVETVIDAVEAETGHVGVTVVEAIVDAARSGHESGDGIVWTSPLENVTHNRTGLPLAEVEQHGGTHGSPRRPPLHTSPRQTGEWAALGQSPAPPAATASRPRGEIR